MIESDPLNQPSDNTEDRPITPPPTETLIPNAPLKINPKNPANEYQIKLLTDDLGINVPEYLTQNLFKNNGPFSDIN